MVFDEFDENDGAWVDDSDEWQWVPMPRGGLPRALPVTGAWRPGLLAGPVEKIYLSRPTEKGLLLLVKWKGLAHIHSQWVPQAELSVEDSKYLGGDFQHTHMVKGLDFALLKKVRRLSHVLDICATSMTLYLSFL